MEKPKRITQIKDNKWYKCDGEEFSVCCDCCLVHSVEYSLKNGILYYKFTRDDAYTKKLRKDKKAQKILRDIVSEL